MTDSASGSHAGGPLVGVKILEFAGLGPAPFACMLLSDMGADVVSVHRPGQGAVNPDDLINRGRRRVALDMKQPADVRAVLELSDRADVLIEGFRPGVMERLGIGPQPTMARNPRLIYARMTGWGQEGPFAHAAGHDINYIAISGALDSFRASNGEIVAPLNMVGDYGGGALYLVMGVLAALYERSRSHRGQVIDAAMCDGAASLMTMFHAMRYMGFWSDHPGANMLDGGAHYYRVYETKDGGHFSLGALEPQFYAEFLRRAGIEDPAFKAQNDRAQWPALREKLAAIFKTKTRAEWAALLEGTDACALGVRAMGESMDDPHLAARKTFVSHNGRLQAAPAPRFSRTPGRIQESVAAADFTVEQAIIDWSVSASFPP